jgi:hypothetical protein
MMPAAGCSEPRRQNPSERLETIRHCPRKGSADIGPPLPAWSIGIDFRPGDRQLSGAAAVIGAKSGDDGRRTAAGAGNLKDH